MTYLNQLIQQHPDARYWHQQYPWFSIGRLVDTANKKDTPGFKESAQKTAVFFNNIQRLHFLLYQQDTDMNAIKALVQPLAQTSKQDAITAIKIEEKVNNTGIDLTAKKETTDNTETVPNKIVESANVENKFSDQVPAKEPVAKLEITETPHSAISPEINNAAQQTAAFDTVEELTEDDLTDETEPEETADKELLPLPTNMLSESLAQAAAKFKNEPVNEDALVFKTAYQHTVDYFASQGIKLDGEPAKDDRFGQQVKTFTSWLRQMKRLNETVLEADPLVESHAAHSLQKDDVLTESMADVLLKQGKNSQAIYVLEKLRLLHPQKSHYFAARIDQIKLL